MAPCNASTLDLTAWNTAPRKGNISGETTNTDRVSRRRITADSTLPEIPDDLVQEILACLPVKSLLRFKCVCKAWCATVSTQSFIAAHLQHSTSNHRCQPSFLISPYQLDLCQNTFSNNISFYEWRHDSLGGRQATTGADHVYTRDFRGRFRLVYTVAHCDGLVLLPTDNKLYVLNPATRELLTLPESIRRVHHPYSFCRGTLGFGRDPSTNRYKVVQCFHRPGDYIWGMQVFTIGSSWWRDVVPPCPVQNQKNATFFKGSLFWFLPERQAPESRLLRFCLRAETFSFTAHPPCPGLRHQNLNLSELNGELCLAHYESSHRVVAIWMTNSGVNPQWHRRYVLNIGEPCVTMAISPYGLLLKKDDYKIMQYDFQNKKIKVVASLEDLRYHGPGTRAVKYLKGENLFCFGMIPYTQSLVSIANAK